MKNNTAWNRMTMDNKLFIISIGVTIVSSIIGAIVKAVKTHKAHRRERLIYDRSNGFYIEPKHKLSVQEAVEFDARRQAGETAIQILRDMNNVRNISK